MVIHWAHRCQIKVEIEDDFVEIELDTWLSAKDACDKISENLVNYDGKHNIVESVPKGTVNIDNSLLKNQPFNKEMCGPTVSSVITMPHWKEILQALVQIWFNWI